MKTNFTPGPWQVKEPYGAVFANGETVAMVDNHYVPTERAPFPIERSTRESNAKLIASAPDLLEALQSVVAHLGTRAIMERYAPGVLKQVVTAIQKSTT